jgi:twitching motility two-component system response regulator PilH
MARILVVDDSPTETHHFVNISGAARPSGADGDQRCRRHRSGEREQPDVILMDVVMPGVNGFQATRQLTRGNDTRHIPVIIVSSKSQDADRVWGERQGACGYLTKPVDDRTLIDAVNDVLGH